MYMYLELLWNDLNYNMQMWELNNNNWKYIILDGQESKEDCKESSGSAEQRSQERGGWQSDTEHET